MRAWGTLTVRAVIADAGDDGVLARRHDDSVVAGGVHLGPRRRGRSPGEQTRPGRGGPPACPTRSWRRRYADRPAPGSAPTSSTAVSTANEAGLVARMLHGVDGRAQIAVAVPDRWGVLRRSGELLEVLDGPAGRYLMTRTRGGDGTCWTTVAPVDDRRLRQRLAELLEQDGPLSPGRRAASAAGLPR